MVPKSVNTVFFACDKNFYEKYGWVALKSSLCRDHHTLFCIIGEMENPYPSNHKLTFYTIPNIDVGMGEIRSWFASVRFIEAKKLLPRYDDLLILDSDVIIRKDFDWSKFNKSIMLYYYRVKARTKWLGKIQSDIRAGAVYLKNNSTGISFINDVNEQLKGIPYGWYRDQMALTNIYKSYNTFRIPIHMNDKLDTEDTVWFGTSSIKKTEKYKKEMIKYE